MALNKPIGNMYKFVTHTWNAIKGQCIHNCDYCYMKSNWTRFPKQNILRLDEKTLKDNLGENRFIFVGSSTDMFADNVPKEWIIRTLKYCRQFPKNKYLFQTKNPKRFWEFINYFPKDSLLCATIESNRDYNITKAPGVKERVSYMKNLPFKIMITIEPILDFDLREFIDLIKEINPNWVNIGADSKRCDLKEPSKEKIELLIEELSKIPTLELKSNLERLRK